MQKVRSCRCLHRFPVNEGNVQIESSIGRQEEEALQQLGKLLVTILQPSKLKQCATVSWPASVITHVFAHIPVALLQQLVSCLILATSW